MTPINTIRPAENDDLVKANQISLQRQKTPPPKALPDDIKRIGVEYVKSGGAVVIEFSGDNQLQQAEQLSRKIRGHLANPEFNFPDTSLIVIDEDNEPKLVMRRKKVER